MVDNRVSMPSGSGGLVRFFDESTSKIIFKPGHIILFVILIVVIEIILQWQGYQWLGLA